MSTTTKAPEAAEDKKPKRDGQWTKHVKKNMPANFKGTEKQYMDMYFAHVDGFNAQAEKAIAQLYPEACRVAAIKKEDLETPVVEVLFKIKFDFSDPEVAQFNGHASFEEKKKHDSTLGYVLELNPKGPGKQTDMITNPPTETSPTLGLKPGEKAAPVAAPHNKKAPATTTKASKRAATPPAQPTETAQPAAADKK